MEILQAITLRYGEMFGFHINFILLQFIWLVVFIATVLLGVDLGLGIGVAFSLAVILFKIVL